LVRKSTATSRQLRILADRADAATLRAIADSLDDGDCYQPGATTMSPVTFRLPAVTSAR
jgi:hypothetical protein